VQRPIDTEVTVLGRDVKVWSEEDYGCFGWLKAMMLEGRWLHSSFGELHSEM